MDGVRKKAVYLPSNIEYLARAAGVDGPEGVIKKFCSSEWFVTARCFFAGLPLMAPVSLLPCPRALNDSNLVLTLST